MITWSAFYFGGEPNQTLEILTEANSPLKIEKDRRTYYELSSQKINGIFEYMKEQIFIEMDMQDERIHKEDEAEFLEIKVSSILSYHKNIEEPGVIELLKEILDYMKSRNVPLYFVAKYVKPDEKTIFVRGFNPEKNREVKNPKIPESLKVLLE